MKKSLLTIVIALLTMMSLSLSAASYVSKITKIIEAPPLKVRVTVSGGAIDSNFNEGKEEKFLDYGEDSETYSVKCSGVVGVGQEIYVRCEFLNGFDDPNDKDWANSKDWNRMRANISRTTYGSFASDDRNGGNNLASIEMTYKVEKDSSVKGVDVTIDADSMKRGKIRKVKGVNMLVTQGKHINFHLDYRVEKKLNVDGLGVYVDPKDKEPAPRKDGLEVEEFVCDAPVEPGEQGWEIPEKIVKVISGKDVEKKTSYRMYVLKDFDNILIPGGDAEMLMARIVKHAEDGKETTDKALTSKIAIRGDEYLILGAPKSSGNYTAVSVTAPEIKKVPDKAIVSFSFEDDKGNHFLCHMHFVTAKPRILFGQEDMNLPAGYKEIVRLPFVVDGLDEDAEVTAKIDDGGRGFYNVKVEYNEKERLHYAIIQDTLKEANGAPGDSEYYPLRIKAKKGDVIAEGELLIYRFKTGLRLQQYVIECYPGAKIEPSFLTLYDVDPRTQEIRQLAPNGPDKDKQVQDPRVPLITGYHITAANKEQQELVNNLHIVLQTASDKHNFGSGGRVVTLRPVAFLIPPNRIKATVDITVEYYGETYSVKQPVLLTSQPRREKLTKDTEAEDMKTLVGLQGIRSVIYRNGWYQHLFPLVRIIDMMEDGYDPWYGYDPGSVATIMNVFNRFVNGETLGANATAQQVTFADELAIFMQSFVKSSEDAQNFMNSGYGILARLALGYFTGGASEAVFQGLDFVCNSVEMANEAFKYAQSDKASATGVFFIGAKIVGREAIGEGIGMAAGKVQSSLKKSGFTMRDFKNAGAEMLENTGFFAGTKGQKILAAMRGSAAAQAQAAKSAKGSFKKLDPAKMSQGEREMLKAYEHGQVVAKERLENLQAAMELYKSNPTATNKKMFNDMVLQCQEDKAAMYMMQNYKDTTMTSMRKEFNEAMSGFHSRATASTQKDLLEFAKKNNLDVKKIGVENATGNSAKAIKDGTKVPMDRDTTFYFIDSKGNKHYFNEKVTTELYNKNLFKETRGFAAADVKYANRNAQKLDSTVIENVLSNPESYGKDLEKMTKEEFRKLKLSDPEKVKKTVRHKMEEWFSEGEDLMEKGFSTKNSMERTEILKLSNDKFREGYRQGAKMFDKCLEPRDILRAAENGGTKITAEMRKAVEIARMAADPVNPKSFLEIEYAMKDMGLTREQFVDAMSELVTAIQ